MTDERLFSEFEPIPTEKWEEIIQKDLKGADYEKKLVWRTDEGFKVRPYYRAEDLNAVDYLNTMPDEFPYTRGTKADHNNWEIVQEINATDLQTANQIAAESLKAGATTVSFSMKNVKNAEDLATLLTVPNKIEFANGKAGIVFRHACGRPVELLRDFIDFMDSHGIDKTKVKGGISYDGISCCLRHGQFRTTQEDAMNTALELVKLAADMPDFRVVNVRGIQMHNGGATIVQEIGYTLGIANEYLAYATSNGLSVEQMAKKMEVTLSVASNYFMEIAKLRAFRLLWATMVNAYQPKCDCACKARINSVASTWNKTIYDPYVNMLRTTTEGMAAALGGADTIALQPFDVTFKDDDDFSRRISRNVQIILKEESYFDKVVDPAAGSYYIENLTDSIAENAWKLFQEVDSKGGMIPMILSGEIKAAIEASCQKRDMDIATRKYILLGTNQYPNINDAMLDKIERQEEKSEGGLQSYRGARAFEELRLETERMSKTHGRPKVFLLKIGNLAMRQARAGFVTNFFGCAGYEIFDNTGFATVAEGIEAAKAIKADIVVVCSSDEEYATFGLEAAKAAKAEGFLFVVAGNPVECAEALKEAGTDAFIHVRTNVLDCLKDFNKRLFQ